MKNPFSLKNGFDDNSQPHLELHDAAGLDFEESLAGSESTNILERSGDNRPKVFLLWTLIVVIFGIIVVHLYSLAIMKHQYYQGIADGNRLRIEYLAAPRGVIYDSSGQVLAGNKPSFEVVANPLDLPKDQAAFEQIVAKLAGILQMDPNDIKQPILDDKASVYQSVLIKQNITRDEALILDEQSAAFPGFEVINSPIRDYQSAPDFGHVLGYVGKISPDQYKDQATNGYLYNDSLGKSGLEQVYESYLRGTFGQQQVEVDARGVVDKTYGEKAPVPGDNLYLNIDAGLQQVLFDTLSQKLRELGKRRGAAVAVNPQNGKILALVSMPSFDNNAFAEGIDPAAYQKLLADKDQPLFDRVIQGLYPPGSTVKPMIASAALQEGVVSPGTVIDDTGKIIIHNLYGGPDYYFYGYNHTGLGPLDIRHAIAMSSDIYFYEVGGGYAPDKLSGLGIDRLDEYLKRYNLSRPLGIDLPGEQGGLVPTPEWKRQRFAGDPVAGRWYLGDTYHLSIGQGDLLVTPLQMVSWVATVANGGTIYRPYIVDKITDNNGTLIKEFTPQGIGHTGIDPQIMEIVREGMRLAVTTGTARTLSQLPIPVAAKTGTAQFDAKDPNRSHAWFSAFAPYDNPQIAIVVLLEDGGEGGINAVPVVKEVLNWWAKNRYLLQPVK